MSMLLMASLLDLARHSFAIHRRRRRGGADYDGSHFIDVHAHFLAKTKPRVRGIRPPTPSSERAPSGSRGPSARAARLSAGRRSYGGGWGRAKGT